MTCQIIMSEPLNVIQNQAWRRKKNEKKEKRKITKGKEDKLMKLRAYKVMLCCSSLRGQML